MVRLGRFEVVLEDTKPAARMSTGGDRSDGTSRSISNGSRKRPRPGAPPSVAARARRYEIRFSAITRVAPFLVLFACASASGGEPAWRYVVSVSADLRRLDVEAWIAPGFPAELSVDDGAEPFVRNVELALGDRWQTVAERDRSWTISPCEKNGCHLRYHFLLADAAARLDSEVAARIGSAIQAPPTTWLLHPISARRSGEYRFTVSTPNGVQFATGVREVPGVENQYGSEIEDLGDAPYSAFGKLDLARVSRSDGRIDVAFVPAQRTLSNEALLDWVGDAAHALETYYGRLPLPRWLILVTPSNGDEAHGRTLGNGGATILLSVGDRMTKRDLERDWVLTHEMVHLAFPNVGRNQRWIEEGIATYVEPIARARAGQLTDNKVWGDMVAGLPHGQPEPGDRGLDRTPTWGRTYWGGALFCFVADIQIRERTQNRRSLDDALRAIVAAGGTIAVRWPIEKALEIGDRATGVTVLHDLYASMATSPVRVDLADLWRRLGVRVVAGNVEFDDRAPLAAIRRSITMPNATPRSLPH